MLDLMKVKQSETLIREHFPFQIPTVVIYLVWIYFKINCRCHITPTCKVLFKTDFEWVLFFYRASSHSLFTVSEPAVPEPHRTLSDRTVSEPPSVSGSERA